MKIRYGVSTLFALGESFGNIVKIITRSRVEHWQIFDDGQHSICLARAEILCKLARSLEITFSFHAPMAETNIGTLSRELAGPILKKIAGFTR